MKRLPIRFAAVIIIALTVLTSGAPAQDPKKADIVGTWTGYANAPGMRFELTAVFGKTEAGYTGKLSDASGALADNPLREIVFKEGKVTFAFDLVMGTDPMPIRIELTLANETLKGAWFDSEGNSDIVELVLKR
jgi:hypothetical protein